ncbi:hypothetical protein ACFZBU_11220 [Embleya sp. NPDC008237]
MRFAEYARLLVAKGSAAVDAHEQHPAVVPSWWAQSPQTVNRGHIA